MYEKMHILSPLVPPREYYFLRHCQQLEQGLWVIMDVSCDWPHQENISHSRCWRLPSGCMIQEMPNGCSNVSYSIKYIFYILLTLSFQPYIFTIFSHYAYL